MKVMCKNPNLWGVKLTTASGEIQIPERGEAFSVSKQIADCLSADKASWALIEEAPKKKAPAKRKVSKKVTAPEPDPIASFSQPEPSPSIPDSDIDALLAPKKD